MTQVAVKERGIIFTPWSIPKIMDRTKTQTRRTWGLEKINKNPNNWEVTNLGNGKIAAREKCYYDGGFYYSGWLHFKCPYGRIGDRLWVKETWTPDPFHLDETLYKANTNEYIEAILKSQFAKWKSPRFMPRRASRQDLEITDLWPARLQGITEADAIAEGVEQIFQEPDEHTNKALKRIGAEPVTKPYPIGYRNYLYKEDKRYRCCPPASMFPEYYNNSIDSFHSLWDSLNPKYSFDFNPWAWPIGFKLI